MDVLEWWKSHESELCKAFKLIVLVQPLSAASEGVSSLLKTLFLHNKKTWVGILATMSQARSHCAATVVHMN